MTKISAKVIEASVPQADGNKNSIVTFELEYPRSGVHEELLTHRMFSRNSSSSRATPVREVLRRVVRDPALPIYWGSNQKGQVAGAELRGWRRWAARAIVLAMRWPSVIGTWLLMKIGLAKQHANRYLEPWAHIRVVVTATERGNFYNLRDHKDAAPEIRELARKMWWAEFNALQAPRRLKIGEWHLPYVSDEERATFDIETLRKLSAARCARVSVLTHDGRVPTTEEDLGLYDRLMKESPKHASPTEHQATPARSASAWSGNFKGWTQHRKLIPGENLPVFEGPAVVTDVAPLKAAL